MYVKGVFCRKKWPEANLCWLRKHEGMCVGSELINNDRGSAWISTGSKTCL